MIEFRSPTVREILNVAGSLIGVSLVGMLGFVIYALVYVKVPVDNLNALNLVLGNLTGLVGVVVAYFFGSSSTDKKKTETIDALAKTAQVAGQALAGGGSEGITIAPGETATTVASDEGTTISKDPP